LTGFIETMKSITEALDAPSGPQAGEDIELSVVMPCLNERATVGTCVRKALGAMGGTGYAEK